jgi:DNA processing protein
LHSNGEPESNDRSSNHASVPSDTQPTVFVPSSARCTQSPRQIAQLRSWLQLQATLGLAPEHAVRLLSESPDPARALQRAKRPLALNDRGLDHSVQQMAERGYCLLPWTSSAYPPRLAAIVDPAPALNVAGNHDLLRQPSVAIVGARAATVYGLEVARALGFRLAQAGISVVSGLARGIDAAAHRGALEAGGPTVAIQACGPDRIYPGEHRELAEEIRACGALVTELPVGTPPRRPYFPLRNRLISGLSIAVVVVEAREKSGSLITARHALNQGREVLALPGPVTSPTSWGPNRLIRDGAVPVLEANDVFSVLGIAPSEVVATAGNAGGDDANESEGTRRRAPAESGVLAVLAERSLTRDELGRRMDCDPRQLDLELVDLELEGRVGLDRDGRIARRDGPGWAGPK